ncbi:MAG: succinate dehydrogenase, hydrophobic membrane anchor protein [Candidatus Schekmanbacteria bacterium]|nr:MAG: succinate dehydrogenase, hydrophobic membrane anchor protein [Candidatus Schekmanbacteria bacterium]
MALENRVSSDSGAINWFFQRITGLVLLFLLLIHFWIMHYSGGEENILFDAVVKRLADPKFKVIDLSFLVLGLYHGLNGIWMVVQDYIKSPAWKTTIFSLLSFVGLILVVLGFVAVLPISPDWVNIP